MESMPSADLSRLSAFVEVAERGSFARAAGALGRTTSTISHAIKALEDELQLRLLNRTTRSVALTEAGARLLERLSPALSEIAGAVDQLHEERGVPAGLLRINAPEPAVGLVLAPMIGPFLAAYPKVELEIISETSFVDIVAGGFDAGVRWDESLAKDMIAVPLSGPQRYVVAAAPGLIARVGMPKAPEDLLSRPCIRVRYPSGVRPPWEFERHGRVLKLEPPACFASTSLQAMMQAALDGAGFILTFEAYAAEHVAAGRLVTLLDDWQPPFPGPFLYYPSRRHTPGPLRAFIDFVKAWPRT